MDLRSFVSLICRPTFALGLSIVFCTVFLSYLSVLKHYAFMSTAWDLGIYEQVLWSTANTGKVFWYTVEIAVNPSCSFFGVHFTPILFLVLPIYALFQVTETLLVLQAFFIAIAAVPLYKFVLHETRSRKQALTFSILYLTYPPILGVALFDFHVQAFLPFLFFSAFYYFKKEDWKKYLLFIILAALVIEFVPLIVVFFGLYGLWINRKKIFHLIKTLNVHGLLSNRSIFFSIFTIVLGFGVFILARSVTSSINPYAPPHPNWSAFGDPTHDIVGFVSNVVTNPVRTLEIIATPLEQKSVYIFGLFAPLAFLSLLDLPSLLIGAPWFLAAFLSNFAPYYAPLGYQYVAFVTPFLFISAVYGARRMFSFASSLSRRFTVIPRISTSIRRWKMFLVLLLVFVMAIAYVTVLDIRVSVPTVSEHNRIAEYFASLVPQNASVLTQNDLFPHLSRRLYGYVLTEFSQYLPSEVALDYILIDVKSSWFESPIGKLVSNLTRAGFFGVQYAADGLWLLKKNYRGETIYPMKNGILMNFYNQGVKIKLFDGASFNSDPAYENVTQRIWASEELNIPKTWNEKVPFALMFEGWLYAPVSGNYSFTLEGAGSSYFYIDNERVLSCRFSTDYGTFFLERGFHSIRIEYIRENSTPLVRLLWKPPWEAYSKEIDSEFLYPSDSPEISSPFLSLSWHLGYRAPAPLISGERFSVRMVGSLYASSSGVYKFKMLTSGHSSMTINGELVLNYFENSTKTEVEIFLNQGYHEVEIDCMLIEGEAWSSVQWVFPGNSKFEEISPLDLQWQES